MSFDKSDFKIQAFDCWRHGLVVTSPQFFQRPQVYPPSPSSCISELPFISACKEPRPLGFMGPSMQIHVSIRIKLK